MAQPYSDDLRLKLLDAYEAGVGSLRKLAAQFRVSWGYTKKIRVQQTRTGQKKRLVQQRNGPVSRMNSEVQARLRGWLREQPDLTEAELRAGESTLFSMTSHSPASTSTSIRRRYFWIPNVGTSRCTIASIVSLASAPRPSCLNSS